MNDAAVRRRNHWVNHIVRHAHEKPDAVYLRFQGGSVTWSQLRDRVNAVAAAMASRGVTAGQRVAVMMTNRPEFLETMFAANALGAIAVPINFRLAPDEVAFILTDSGARLLVVDQATGPAAAAARAACPHQIGFVSVGGADGADPWFLAPDFPAGPVAGQPPLVDIPEDSPALIMYTSGTTGRPKGAVISHQNLQAQALTVIRAFALCSDGEVNLIASPLFHSGGIGSIVPTILIGGTTVITPSGAFEPSAVLDILED